MWVDVDATGLLAARAGAERPGPASRSACSPCWRGSPCRAAALPGAGRAGRGDEIVVPARVDLGFAAQTDRGLVVPVVHDAHRLSTRELSAALARATEAARDGRLTPAELTGGTFTVNNYGVFGVDGSAAIINHPEVAILGIGPDHRPALGGRRRSSRCARCAS